MKGSEYHSVELVVNCTESIVGVDAPQIPETGALAVTTAPAMGVRKVALMTLIEAPNGWAGNIVMQVV